MQTLGFLPKYQSQTPPFHHTASFFLDYNPLYLFSSFVVLDQQLVICEPFDRRGLPANLCDPIFKFGQTLCVLCALCGKISH